MTGHEPADGGGQRERTNDGGRGVASMLGKRAKNGTLALAAGGIMLARAARAATQSRGRAAVRALAGAGLVVVGMRQRRSASTAGETPEPYPPTEEPPTAEGARKPDVSFPERPDERDVGRPGRETGTEQIEVDISEATGEADERTSTEVQEGRNSTETEDEEASQEVETEGGEASEDESETRDDESGSSESEAGDGKPEESKANDEDGPR